MDNTWTESWPEFFIERRLRPALKQLAQQNGIVSDVFPGRSEEICERGREMLDQLPKDLRPSTLHGDLWYEACATTRTNARTLADPVEEFCWSGVVVGTAFCCL